MAEWILSMAVSLVGSHPAFSAFLMVIGVLRVAMKPLMLLLESVIKYTPTKADDSALAKFMDGDIYKAIVFLLDWFASVKLPKK